MQTIVEALEIQAAQRGNEIFCHFLKERKVEAITYSRLYREACRYARLFRGRGIVPGNVVLIILNHTPELYYAFLGAMLGGLIPSFMPFPTSKQDPRLYWESHRALFQLIGAGALLTYPEHVAQLHTQMPDLALNIMTPQDAIHLPTHFNALAVNPDSIAFLQHSSGTTGLKKGVALSHRAVLDQVASYAAAIHISPADRIVTWLPLYHDMGLISCFILPLITGTPIVQMDPFEWVSYPQMLFEAISRYCATLCWLPNFAFHHLCRTVKRGEGLNLRSMRAWINCSEPCKADTFALFALQFAALGVTPQQLQVCYAMAETVFAVTQTTLGMPVAQLHVDSEQLRSCQWAMPVIPGQPSTSFLSTGPAISSLNYKIADAQGLPLSDNQIGEIAIAGSCLFSGYFKREEETRKKLRDTWYFTGDLGFRSQGELYITGRKNDMIIVHGRNYYAHELEFVVNQAPGVKPGRNVAVGYFRADVGSEDVVIIAESDDTHAETLIADIKQRLLDSSGLLPYDVRIVQPGWLVKTTSGKISRNANLDKYLADIAAVPV
jgi:acyl-CoA synthetase (AMP-forming)/AMP-acid ligase II